jgi:hypothetical protein
LFGFLSQEGCYKEFFSTILALQLFTYIVIITEMPCNDSKYQGLGNWVHQKKRKERVVRLPPKQNRTKLANLLD